MTTSYRPEIPNEAHLHLGFSFRSPSEAEKLGSARLPLLLVFSVFLAFRVCQFTFRQGTPPIWFDLRTSPVQAVAVACVWALIEEQEQAMPSSDEWLIACDLLPFGGSGSWPATPPLGSPSELRVVASCEGQPLPFAWA